MAFKKIPYVMSKHQKSFQNNINSKFLVIKQNVNICNFIISKFLYKGLAFLWNELYVNVLDLPDGNQCRLLNYFDATSRYPMGLSETNHTSIVSRISRSIVRRTTSNYAFVFLALLSLFGTGPPFFPCAISIILERTLGKF